MTRHLDEGRPPGDGREAAASEEKKSKVNKQNTTDFDNGEAVAPTFREQRDG
jgi:hypothetical protein